jgi:gas vesicle protein
MPNKSRDQNGELASFIGGTVLGLIVSAPLAVWLSPRSGQQSRSAIRQRGVLIRRKAGRAIRQPVEQVQGQIGQIQERVGSQINQLQDKVESIRGDSTEDAIKEGKTIAAQHRSDLTLPPPPHS